MRRGKTDVDCLSFFDGNIIVITMLEKKTELKLKKRKRGENNYLIAIGSIPCSHFFLRFFLFY